MAQGYLLYEADAWLSYDSMVLMGVFTTDENLLEGVRKLAKSRLEFDKNAYRTYDGCEVPDELSEEVIDEILEEVVTEFTDNDLQTNSYKTNFYATEVTLNEVDENGIR